MATINYIDTLTGEPVKVEFLYGFPVRKNGLLVTYRTPYFITLANGSQFAVTERVFHLRFKENVIHTESTESDTDEGIC